MKCDSQPQYIYTCTQTHIIPRQRRWSCLKNNFELKKLCTHYIILHWSSFASQSLLVYYDHQLIYGPIPLDRRLTWNETSSIAFFFSFLMKIYVIDSLNIFDLFMCLEYIVILNWVMLDTIQTLLNLFI